MHVLMQIAHLKNLLHDEELNGGVVAPGRILLYTIMVCRKLRSVFSKSLELRISLEPHLEIS